MTNSIRADGAVVRVSTSDPSEEFRESIRQTDVTAVGSTGVTALEPLAMVTRDGRTAFHVSCGPARAARLAEDVEDSGDVHAGDPDAVVEHDPETATLPVPDGLALDVGTRTVLGACGWRRPANRADHEAAGGFDDSTPSAVFDAGLSLHGRGWGDICHDEPVGDTWEAVADAEGDRAVVVNGHGTPADALLLASAPFDVLDGAAALARAVDAARIVVYASEADERAVETATEAVENYPELPAPTDVVAGPDAHRAAEPTMALEAIEGNHRLEARLRPPGPETVGLHGQPTLVHTPRTLAHLALRLRTGTAPDTRLVTVGGDVSAAATVELSAGEPLSTAMDAVDVAGAFKAAAVGGRFGGLTDDLDVGADPDSLADAGLGTEGSVRVLADDRCLVEFVGTEASFASEENCGRCVPCREGTTQLASLLRDVYGGSYDPAKLEELIRVMGTSSICAFGIQAGRPVRTAMDEFESEFEAHANGRCPAGSCTELTEAS